MYFIGFGGHFGVHESAGVLVYDLPMVFCLLCGWPINGVAWLMGWSWAQPSVTANGGFFFFGSGSVAVWPPCGKESCHGCVPVPHAVKSRSVVAGQHVCVFLAKLFGRLAGNERLWRESPPDKSCFFFCLLFYSFFFFFFFWIFWIFFCWGREVGGGGNGSPIICMGGFGSLTVVLCVVFWASHVWYIFSGVTDDAVWLLSVTVCWVIIAIVIQY